MRYFKPTYAYAEPEPEHRLCGSPMGDVTLQQKGKDNFAVRYGKLVDAELTYAEAARKLGEALMHQLAADGQLDNRMRGEN